MFCHILLYVNPSLPGVDFVADGDRLTCPICGEMHTGFSHLKEHIRGVHSNIKHFLCQLCDFEAPYRHPITKHFNSEHPGEELAFVQRPFDLKTFVELFRSGASVRNINSARASSTPKTSKKPKSATPKVVALKTAPNNFGSTKRYIDGYPFDTLATNGYLVCPICSKALISSEKMRFHVRGCHHTKKHLVCKVIGCGQKFNWRSTIINHQILDHGKNYGSDKIEVLPLHLGKFIRRYLQKHKDEDNEAMTPHQSPNPLSPSFQPEMTTPSPKRQRLSFKTEPGTSSSATNNLTCPLCPITTDDAISLRDHVMAVHSDVKNYVCAVNNCNQAFNCRTGVLTHQKRAHAYKKDLGLHLVEIIPDDLERYLARQTEEGKEWVDEDRQTDGVDSGSVGQSGNVIKVVNGISFTYDAAGNVHCPLCNKKFRFAGALKRHVMETHSGQKWYRCLIDDCGVRLGS